MSLLLSIRRFAILWRSLVYLQSRLLSVRIPSRYINVWSSSGQRRKRDS
ncbi:BgtTE-56044 [Blumeria graminis f. sp. tritici]|nr:BgtTE-56044 [Blumeria graminis f. sp. tritici]